MRFLISLFFCLIATSSMAAASTGLEKKHRSIAFFYSPDLPVQEASLYPRLVVQPNAIEAWQLEFLHQRGTQVYAYLSVGEVVADSSAPILAVNENWGTQVPDLTSLEWQRSLVAKAQRYQEQGFDGLFLDTMDSFHLVGAERFEPQRQALLAIVKQLSAQMAGKLIFNRGFDILDESVGLAEAVVAEGLYSHYNNQRDSYGESDPEGRRWLMGRLKHAKSLGFDVQVIDYAQALPKREAMADRINKAGFKAWVTDGQLSEWGTSSLRPVPRKLLALYDSRDESFVMSQIHKHLGTMIEYLGYNPVYIDLAERLPPKADPALYAGVVFWPRQHGLYSEQLDAWLGEAMHKIPMLILGSAPTNAGLLRQFGVKPATAKAPYKVHRLDPAIIGEGAVEWDRQDIDQYVRDDSVTGEVLFSLKDANNKEIVQAIKTDAGMLVLGLWPIDLLPNGVMRWRLDPIYLLKKGLGLQDIPAPDVSTETGRRLLLVHIDGDGFPSKAFIKGTPLVPKVILDDVLRKYQLPTTVSVIEAEVGPKGLYRFQSPKLETLAREIFSEDYVEMASHSFSHPFFWEYLVGRSKVDESETLYGFHLDVPGYEVSLEREITGSIDYINSALAPEGKRVKMMLWTGDATARVEALKLAKAAGVLNVNGGVTYTNKNHPSLSQVWPVGRPEKEGLVQLYAPIMNENVYTNDWTGPFYGFRDVIDTFKKTDVPYRLKPMNIYYHFYSGTYPASVKALQAVYQYSMEQPHTAAYLSEYAERAKDMYDVALAKHANGSWVLASQTLKTVRFDQEVAVTNLGSEGVAGFVAEKERTYVHLVGKNPVIAPGKWSRKAPRVVDGNVLLERWQPQGNETLLDFTAYEAAELALAVSGRCHYQANGQRFTPKKVGSKQVLRMSKGVYRGSLVCR